MSHSNPRYKSFQQKIFTAGDYEQFVSTVKVARKTPKPSEGDVTQTDHPVRFFRYGQNWMNTFSYMFEKMKKGIYVQIIDNDVNLFLPFSNANYSNHYPAHVFNVDPKKYSHGFPDLCKTLCEKEGRTFSAHKINRFSKKWYCNNGLVRYEFPVQENDSGIDVLYAMLKSLCEKRSVPDCEFFLNKRDFPVLKRDMTDPYEALVGGDGVCIWEDKDMIPIISMCSKDIFADLMFPTWEDWMRASFQHDPELVFPDYRGQFKVYPEIVHRDWREKKPMVVFRGASTGLGVDSSSNPRLFYSELAMTFPDILDVGITKWNLRPRKSRSSDFLDIIEPGNIPLLDYKTPQEQSEYRYVLHLPGHSCAYRLSYELSMNCVLFIYPCEYKLWFSHLLVPYTHYIPLESTFSKEDIIGKFKWCEEHPDDCERIAKNARAFYEKHLTFDAVLDYCRDMLVNINSWMHSKETNVVYHDVTIKNKIVYEELGKKRIDGVVAFDQILRGGHNTTIYGSSADRTQIMKVNKNVLHEYLVGRTLGCLSRLSPCFIQIRSLLDHDRFTMDYRPDWISLESLIAREDLFSFGTLLNIFRQIVLTLRLAQRFCGFIHFDLCPWNIMLQRNSNAHSLYFRFPTTDVVLSNCEWIVKVIDFDKSHIVCNGQSFYNSVPFFRSVVQDIKCFWFHCASLVLHKHKLSRQEMSLLMQIIESISSKKFSRIGDVKTYLLEAKKYANLSKPHTSGLRTVDLKFLFKDDNVAKRTSDNMSMYKQVVDNLMEFHGSISLSDKSVLIDSEQSFEDIIRTDYLDPVENDKQLLFPMFSATEEHLATDQYALIYKGIQQYMDKSVEIPNLKKKIAQYFNLI